MRKITSTLVLCLVLTSCATTAPYGNFVKNSAVSLDQKMIANDTVQQLVTLYPPAKTRFELQQSTPDLFGQAFVTELRTKGYALLELNPKTKKIKQSVPDSPIPTGASTYTSSLPLWYVLDQAKDMNLYRVTIIIGNQSITRPYTQENGTIAPAGYWARKE